MRESLLLTSLRAFLKAFFCLIGIALAIVPILAILGLFYSAGDTEPDRSFSVELQPNAEGVRKSLSKTAPVILKIPIRGVIGLEGPTMHSIRDMLVESREGTLKNDRVKAILLDIESPGGTVVDADGIYRALKSYKEQYKVPIYAYVDGVCASGAMYIACSADKIYASEVSLVGSVGVLIPAVLNFSKLIETVGVQSLTLSAGKGKDELNPLRPWKPGEQDKMQAIVNSYYNQFVDIVLASRPKLDRKLLVDDYGAHIFTAEQAQQQGFIDESGLSLRDTMKLLLKEIGIEDDNYQVVQLEKSNWFTTLFTAQSTLFTGKVKHQLQLTPELDAALLNKPLYLYQPGL